MPGGQTLLLAGRARAPGLPSLQLLTPQSQGALGKEPAFTEKPFPCTDLDSYSTDLFAWMIQLTIQLQDAERCLSTALHVALQSHLYPLENTKTSAQNSGRSQRTMAEETSL